MQGCDRREERQLFTRSDNANLNPLRKKLLSQMILRPYPARWQGGLHRPGTTVR
jgi:hypothetical protein